jgi:hypothetical protein
MDSNPPSKLFAMESSRFALLETFEVPTEILSSITFSNDPDVLVTGSYCKTKKRCSDLNVWKLPKAKSVSKRTVDWGEIKKLSFSLDSGALVISSDLPDLAILKMPSLDLDHSIKDGFCRDHVVVQHGQYAVSVTNSGKIAFWETRTAKLKRLFGDGFEQGQLAASLDGRFLAITNKDNSIALWDIVNDKKLFTLIGHVGAVAGLCFNRDGSVLASSGVDDSIRFWDTVSGRCCGLRNAWPGVNRICYSRTNATLISAGFRNGLHGDPKPCLTLWDVRSESKKRVYYHDSISCLAVSQDGSRLAVGLSGGKVFVYKLW